jgi:CRISPR system Cascade subunit CasD
MPSHLLFTLAAPIAAFGDLTVGEIRSGGSRPARSAVEGLVAAALGIDRADEDGHAAIREGYALAMRMDDPGRPFVDYHTIQAPPETGRKRAGGYATRRDELADPEVLGTMISRRTYRTDVRVTVALRPRESIAAPGPETIAAALKKPAFVLFFGRKSCPLSEPLDPRVIDAPDIMSAYRGYDLGTGDDAAAAFRSLRPKRPHAREDHRVFALDRDFGIELPSNRASVETRRDRVVARKRRQFGLREEIVTSFPGESA